MLLVSKAREGRTLICCFRSSVNPESLDLMANHASRSSSDASGGSSGPNLRPSGPGPGPGPGRYRRSPEMDEDKTSSSRLPLPPMLPVRMHLPGSAIRMSSSGRSAPSLPVRMPRLVATSDPAVITAAATPAEVISLTQPRPDVDRIRNEYIDTPLKGGLHPLHAETHPHIHIGGSPHDHLALVSPLGHSSGGNGSKTLPATSWASSKSLPLSSPSLKRMQSTRRSLPITKQPLTFTKDTSCGSGIGSSSSSGPGGCASGGSRPLRLVASDTSADSSSSTGCDGVGIRMKSDDSIICPQCERCRCLACRTPRPLPSSWMCHDKCLCSADACVDYVSCLCCVKALFYHCACDAEDDACDASDAACADRPCSCSGPRPLARWACLASLSFLLPCLVCYWPLRGGVRCVEMCYQRCTSHGCRCNHHFRSLPLTLPPQAVNNEKTAAGGPGTGSGVGDVVVGGVVVVHTQPISSSSSSSSSSSTSSSTSSSKDLGKRLLDNQ